MTADTKQYELFATTPKGLELLLADELRALGASSAREKLAGVQFSGTLETAYKAVLWSRLANRILLPLIKGPAETPEELYATVKKVKWDEHLAADGSLSVHFVSVQSNITHTLFGAQKVKDAIVDQFRQQYGERPTVAREQPDIHIFVHLHRNTATLYLDLSGESLHKRGYRIAKGLAPLKENLAAAILLRAKWPSIAKEGGALLDPMCGSATFLIEAAMMAGDIAPGLYRDYFGFLKWRKHQTSLWQTVLTAAKNRQAQGISSIPEIIGYDHDADAIKKSFENITRAGFLGKIHVEKRTLNTFSPKQNTKPGLIVCNPPYGERMGEWAELRSLYQSLGHQLKTAFVGWQAAVFTGNPELGKEMGVRSKHYYPLFNGALPCKLLLFDMDPSWFVDRSPGVLNEKRILAAKRMVNEEDLAHVQMFVNRLGKNLKKMKTKTENVQSKHCIYDADIPEYAFKIELTENAAYVQEYELPRGVNKQKAQQRQSAVLAILPDVLHLSSAAIFFDEVCLRK